MVSYPYESDIVIPISGAGSSKFGRGSHSPRQFLAVYNFTDVRNVAVENLANSCEDVGGHVCAFAKFGHGGGAESCEVLKLSFVEVFVDEEFP